MWYGRYFFSCCFLMRLNMGRNSMKLPGQPCMKTIGIASFFSENKLMKCRSMSSTCILKLSNELMCFSWARQSYLFSQ
jgi:hypothetical protein